MSIPLIGGRKPEPSAEMPDQIGVGIHNGKIVVEMTMNGGRHSTRIFLVPEAAAQHMLTIGSIIEQLAPGQLVEILKQWVARLGAGSIKIGLNGEEVEEEIRRRAEVG